MFFKRKRMPEKQLAEPIPYVDASQQLDESVINTAIGITTKSPQARMSSAETAHLIGPGCLKVEGGLLRWEPVEGGKLILHPEYLGRVLLYGATDVTGTAVRMLWRKGIQAIFLSPQGHEILGRLQPADNCPNLPYLQHITTSDSAFRLRLARDLVHTKIEHTTTAARYHQQQGRLKAAGDTIHRLKRLRVSCTKAGSLESLRGVEGTAAQVWFQLFASMLPDGWSFPGRKARPAVDPVNALLSLGYTLLVTRCQMLLAASDLDPLVGFFHEIRPGRPSLACDLMEPQRIALVDCMVLTMLSKKRIAQNAFRETQDGLRLQPEGFKAFLATFEEHFIGKSTTSPRQQIQAQIDDWIRQIREYAKSNAMPGASP